MNFSEHCKKKPRPKTDRGLNENLLYYRGRGESGKIGTEALGRGESGRIGTEALGRGESGKMGTEALGRGESGKMGTDALVLAPYEMAIFVTMTRAKVTTIEKKRFLFLRDMVNSLNSLFILKLN